MFKDLLRITMSGIIVGAAYTAGVTLFNRVILIKGKEAVKQVKGTYKIVKIKKV